MSPSVAVRRPENLTLRCQEVLTAVERLRGNRQRITDANTFRHHTRKAPKIAAQQSMKTGYSADDVKLATSAAAAFLDESVLNSQKPVFGDRVRRPLQGEMSGTQIAGEVFFHNLQQLLGRGDSQDFADLQEVYYLCVVPGFGGRYSAGNRGELGLAMNLTAKKIRWIRGQFPPLSPHIPLPNETSAGRENPLVRKLGRVAAVCGIVGVLLFVVYEVLLSSGVNVA